MANQMGSLIAFVIIVAVALTIGAGMLPDAIGSWQADVVNNSTVVGSYGALYGLLPVFVIIGMVALFALQAKFKIF